MRTHHASMASMALLLTYLLSILVPIAQPLNAPSLDDELNPAYSNVGEWESLNIPIYPDGISNQLTVDLSEGHTLGAINLNITPSPLPRVESMIWDSAAEFNTTAAVFDNVDYNNSGLTILPQGWLYDFEGSAQGWTLDASGGWAHGYDSSLGPTNGVHGGTGAIYTYNGNYPNSMSTTYWATSPSMDCSSCSGSWELSYWKRLGVEYYSYDHAYVHVKNAQGSWSQIFSSTGTVNDGTFYQVTSSISSYINGNPNFQIRFGLGRTDGSVTYTGWNVDDVSVMPVGSGISSGEANWTSPDFGPQAQSGFQGMPGPYGLMSLDMTVPSGASLEWTLIDAFTSSPIAGFVDRIDRVADLGVIDWQTHTALRLEISLVSGSGGHPVIHSINLQGRYADTLTSNPADIGWQLGTASWSSSAKSVQGSGSETVMLPTLRTAAPIARVSHNFGLSGGAKIQASINGENYSDVATNTILTIGTGTIFSVDYQIVGTGSSWQLVDVEIDIAIGSMPTNPRIDVAYDGRYEWSMSDPALGQWGWQDRLGNGYLSAKMVYQTATTNQVGFMLPGQGVDSLSFQLCPTGLAATGVNIGIFINGIEELNHTIGTLIGSTDVVFSEAEVSQINSALSSSPSMVNGEGWTFSQVDIRVTADAGPDILLRGLAAPYTPSVILNATDGHSLLREINLELGQLWTLPGSKRIPIPFQSTGPAGYNVQIVSQQSNGGAPDSYGNLLNLSETQPVTPSYQWNEVFATFNTSEGANRVELTIAAIGHYATFECTGSIFLPPANTGEPPANCVSRGDSHLIEWAEDPGFLNQTGDKFKTLWRFRLMQDWDDEDSLDIMIQMVTQSSVHCVPVRFTFGGGSTLGVENDPVINDWWVINQIGNIVPSNEQYLKPDADVELKIDLGFEDVGSQWAPRTDDVEVYLLQDGNLINSTRVVDQGLATIGATVPATGAYVVWEIRLAILGGGSNNGSSGTGFVQAMSKTFQTDSLSPELVSMNIERHDHLAPSIAQKLTFTIVDRPILPSDIHLQIWQEWLDDSDGNGLPSSDEYRPANIIFPQDMSLATGEYSFIHDDTNAPDGSNVAGWLYGGDAAGNLLFGGGSPTTEDYLFMYQVRRDFAPVLDMTNIEIEDGPHPWLHPEVAYTIVVPLTEQNGFSDLASATLQLASNSQTDTLSIEWDGPTNRCTTTSPDLAINSCVLGSAQNDTTPFSEDLELRIEFEIQWTLVADTYLSREPSITILDRAGQGSWVTLPELRWRYSPDVMVDTSSLSIDIEGAVPNSEGAWVQPGAEAVVRGEVVWATDGTHPQALLDVALLIDGVRHIVTSQDGGFSAEIDMPLISGAYPFNVEMSNLPLNSVDFTDRSTPVMWIVVDGESPMVNDVLSPRANALLTINDLDSLQIELRVSELEQLNPDTLQIHWRVQARGAEAGSAFIAEGQMTPNVIENRLSGQSIPLAVLLDIGSSLEDGADLEALELIVWVTGADMAGNDFDSLLNSEAVPVGAWDIEQRSPEWSLERADISYSKLGDLAEGEVLTVSIEVHNTGRLEGTVELIVEEVRPGGIRTVLQQSYVTIGADSSNTTYVDWTLEGEGAAWIEAHLVTDEENEANGPTIRIVEPAEESIFTGSVAGIDSIYIWLGAIISLLLLVVLVTLLRQSGTKENTWMEDDLFD